MSNLPAEDRLAHHIRNHGLDRTVDECERCVRTAEAKLPCETELEHVCDGAPRLYDIVSRTGRVYGRHSVCQWMVRHEARVGFTCREVPRG